MTRPPSRLVATLAALVAATALVACSSEDDTAAGAVTAGADAAAVTVAHDGGETTLQSVPTRVVILDDAMFGDLIPFGVVPVGTAAAVGDPPVISVLQEPAGVEEVPVVAPDFAPNLEQIAAARPDLIIAMAFQTEEPYWDDLNAIGPTIAVETDATPDVEGDVWERNLRIYGEVFRQEDQATELIDAYDDRVAELSEQYAGAIDGTTVSFATSSDAGTVRVDGPTGWGGGILDDLGFTFPDVQLEAIEANDDFRHELSAEETDRFLSTDVVLWRVSDAGEDVERGFPPEALADNPLLERLPAVASGQVFTVDDRLWFLRSVYGKLLVLDQLEAQILPELAER